MKPCICKAYAYATIFVSQRIVTVEVHTTLIMMIMMMCWYVWVASAVIRVWSTCPFGQHKHIPNFNIIFMLAYVVG